MTPLTPVAPGWQECIEPWAAWLRSAGKPETTLYLRLYHLRRFAVAHDHIEPLAITLDDLTGWLGGHRGWSAETRRSYRASLRQFYGWAHVTGRSDVDPSRLLPAITPPRGRPRPTPESVYRLAVRRADDRVELMVLLASQAGLRRGEIARAHTGDLVDDAHGYSLRVTGKGGTVRLVPLLDELAERLLKAPAGHLFPGQIDGHLSPSYVGKLVSRILGPGWTAHTLRHRFASRAYAAERDLRAVQELLGHAKPETTARYTAIPDGALRAAVRAAA